MFNCIRGLIQKYSKFEIKNKIFVLSIYTNKGLVGIGSNSKLEKK